MSQSSARAGAMAQDKRSNERLPRRLMVRFGMSEPDKTAFTRNISEAGMYLQTNAVFKPGTKLQIVFELGGREFTLRATVMRARKIAGQMARILNPGMGVRFINPGTDWTEHFRQWIEKK